MLPTIIFEPDEETRSLLKRTLFAYCEAHKSQISFLADSDSLDDAARYFEGTSGIMLLMLSIVSGSDASRRGVVQLGRRALKKDRDNYTLYCLHNSADIEALLNTGVRPVGVLLFPFQPEKLGKILARIDRDYAELRERETDAFLTVEAGNTTYRLPLSQILYVEALDKKLTIWMERQSLTVRMTLGGLEEQLPQDRFIRCHRSYMVNLQHVDRVDFTAMTVTLKTGESLPVSRSCRDQLRSVLKKGGEQGSCKPKM